MDTRREFVKKAALLSGSAGIWSVLPASIQTALAIDPEEGSTYLDAEHVVILMQENRSFDHCYGTLQGVRGFNDPRALTLSDGKPVWLQTNKAGETYAPFRLNIKDTNATWMGSLPHSWTNQVDARNNGRHDKWLDAKPSGNKQYAKMPLTLGYYTREDIPFYYAFADAFTVCDQNFCSSLTGTTPNRLYLWTGTIREKQEPASPANVRNEEVDYGVEARWTTFPERLEDLGISWKIYQNEISLPTGLKGEEDSWLSNFTDNPIEWFSQYNVRFASGHRNHLGKTVKTLTTEVDALKTQAASLAETSEEYAKLKDQIQQKTTQLARAAEDRERWSAENFEKLTPREKNLHAKAFCINSGDPFYRQLTTLEYKDGDKARSVQVPKGDVLHQFRQDVQNGTLPAVSWLVAPENFSDHPGAAWYGAWYLSEALDILTKNPEVWKKTIFILTYDENDGYFDHVPPYVVPHPRKPETGQVSKGMDPAVEYVEWEQDRKRVPSREARESAIGLGYRVPMVVASPWSRGGCVCSEIFDHTSVLQFLEALLSHKTGRKVEESNISSWRRTICGDLTSLFQPYHGEKVDTPSFPARTAFIEGIHKAQFKKPPTEYRKLSPDEIEEARRAPAASPLIPAQEKGVRKSSPLPYQLYADGVLSADKTRFDIGLEARNEVFGKRAVGSPFNVFAYGSKEGMTMRTFAVAAGDRLTDAWDLGEFGQEGYHLCVQGPNGFCREFRGSAADPELDVQVDYARTGRGSKSLNGNVVVRVLNRDMQRKLNLEVRDNAYKGADIRKVVSAGKRAEIVIDTRANFGWYDFTLRIAGITPFEKRYAGRVETGKWSYSDPAMGR